MGVTDDELHFRLRDRSQRFWVTEQDLLDNVLFREAADRIEELLRDMVRAKECLRNRMHFYECDCGECDRIRITLEVIKGET
jgi:hypothetical protein